MPIVLVPAAPPWVTASATGLAAREKSAPPPVGGSVPQTSTPFRYNVTRSQSANASLVGSYEQSLDSS